MELISGEAEISQNQNKWNRSWALNKTTVSPAEDLLNSVRKDKYFPSMEL